MKSNTVQVTEKTIVHRRESLAAYFQVLLGALHLHKDLGRREPIET